MAREIENHQFQIKTSTPSVKGSWQVTGVRHDAYAKAHPLLVEEEKDAPLRGFYIHPELFGAPDEKQIGWARHPTTMQHMKERPARAAAATKPLMQTVAASSFLGGRRAAASAQSFVGDDGTKDSEGADQSLDVVLLSFLTFGMSFALTASLFGWLGPPKFTRL